MGRIVNRQILLDVAVCLPEQDPDPSHIARALLDTGATDSGITPAIAERLQLESTEWGRIIGVHGPEDVPLYQVKLVLPISEGGTVFLRGQPSLEVSEFAMLESQSFDVILGMDFLHPFHLTLYQDSFILSN